MPTLTLSREDCEAFLWHLNEILARPANPASDPRISNQEWLERQQRFRNALGAAVTVGAFDPWIALGVLERVTRSGKDDPAIFTPPDSPELLEHVRRLAGIGFFTIQTHNRGHSLMTVASGLTGEDAKVFLGVLRAWDFGTPVR
jgi:hypothetical protein